MTERQGLRLKATDAEDLAIISAFLQDARVPLREMAFMVDEQRFYAVFVRYMRELQEDPTSCDGLTERQAALEFEGIEVVKHRGLDAADTAREYSLLTIATQPGRDHLIHVDLVFEGDMTIQLRTNKIACKLTDFGEPKLCNETPCDHFSQMTYADMAGDAAQA